MLLKISPGLAKRFPGLRALVVRVEGVKVEKEDAELQAFKQKIEETRRSYDLATVKDIPIFRAYRDFFWRVGIDPTKVRPAAEALVRRFSRANRSQPLTRSSMLTTSHPFARGWRWGLSMRINFAAIWS